MSLMSVFDVLIVVYKVQQLTSVLVDRKQRLVEAGALLKHDDN